MTTGNIKQQVLEHIQALSGEQVKTLLFTWLTGTDERLEAFNWLLTNQPNHTINAYESELKEESFEYGEIDTALNFRHLTESQMIQMSKAALEAYRQTRSGTTHDRVRKWSDSLGGVQLSRK